MYRYRHTRLKLVSMLSRGHLSSTTRHIECSCSNVRVGMQLAACANGVRVGCLAVCPRSCGAVRAKRSSAASWSCLVVLAHTGKLKCPLHPTARTDGRAHPAEPAMISEQADLESRPSVGRSGKGSCDCHATAVEELAGEGLSQQLTWSKCRTSASLADQLCLCRRPR